MTQTINFRNAKYQGQTLNGLPHGLGIMIDYKNLFCLAEWLNGAITGNCLVVFGDSKIFYGQIKNKTATGICTYHLKDKSQIFCNFQASPKVKPNQKPRNQRNNQQLEKKNRLVALLPTFKMIIKVQGENEQELSISGEQNYKQNDFNSLKTVLEKMLNFKFNKGELESYLSLENFIAEKFMKNSDYANLLDTVHVSGPEGARELFLTLKTRSNQSSLGIKIQNCMQSSASMTNLHNDGHSYIVKALGCFSKQGILEYGLKNIKTLIKGNVKQQAIYSDEKTIIRYQDEASRPKQCSINIINYLKKSPNFTNNVLAIKHLYDLQAECLNINFNIKQTETKKYAQLILQNPKQFSIQQKEKIEETRLRKLNNGSIQKNLKNDDSVASIYKKQIEESSKKIEQLEKVKQDIYRSVSKKKLHGGSNSPFGHSRTNLNNSPEKQIKPAQLTNVKPILEIYKNTAENSFYNQISNNDSFTGMDPKNAEGYKFSIKKIDHQSDNTKTPVKHLQNGSLSADYIQSLQNRRRLYEETPPFNRTGTLSSVVNEQPSQTTGKKKFKYLPNDEDFSSQHALSRLNSKKNIPSITYNEPVISQRPNYSYGRYNEPQPSVYNPHRHYHDHLVPKKSEQFYFRSGNKSPLIGRNPEKEEDQIGKLGRRAIPKNRLPNNLSQNSNLMTNRKPQSSFEPIILPEFRINQQNNANQLKRPLQDETISPSPKRQHRLNSINQNNNQAKSPLKTQQYRKEYLENPSIRKLGVSRNTPDKYEYRHDVMDPTVGVPKSRTELQGNNLSRSPLQKRKRMLNENPFEI